MRMNKKVTSEGIVPSVSINKEASVSVPGSVSASESPTKGMIDSTKGKEGKRGGRTLNGDPDATMSGVGKSKSTAGLYSAALKVFTSFYLEVKKNTFDISLVQSELETMVGVNVFENLLGAFASYLL
jgi:hypothetical protein